MSYLGQQHGSERGVQLCRSLSSDGKKRDKIEGPRFPLLRRVHIIPASFLIFQTVIKPCGGNARSLNQGKMFWLYDDDDDDAPPVPSAVGGGSGKSPLQCCRPAANLPQSPV